MTFLETWEHLLLWDLKQGRLPSYNHENLEKLQDKMNELERHAILTKLEDVGIIIDMFPPVS